MKPDLSLKFALQGLTFTAANKTKSNSENSKMMFSADSFLHWKIIILTQKTESSKYGLLNL